MTTYNGTAFVAGSLRSVFAQTVLPAEIVVVDDCSTDDTATVVKATARESTVPVRLITLPRNSGGPAKPFNVGIETAKGDVIALLDQDDLMRPGRLEAQVRALLACPKCSVVVGRFTIIGYPENDMSPMWPVPQLHDLAAYIDPDSDYSVIDSQRAFKPLLTRNYAGSMSNLCFTKQLWRRIGKVNERVRTCCDLDFMLRATMAGPIAIVNETITDYRFRGDSLQRQDARKSLIEAELVRLRAASEKSEWAGDDLDGLRLSVMSLAKVLAKEGNFSGFRAIVETLAKHKGFLVMKKHV
jgi:glycosyltransferase involved in cell wall biosynthesis